VNKEVASVQWGMATTRASGSDWRQWRRFRAWGLSQQGWGVRRIALALDASPAAVSGWLAAARRAGPEALSARPRPGAPPKLSPAQKRLIADFLWHGPEAYGFRGEAWTCGRVARVLRQELGVAYHVGHVSRILKALGWTPQVPVTRAIQRDEGAIERWASAAWPALKARAEEEGRTLVLVDESGFYLLPGKVRTYGPEGLTPVIHEWQTRDHLSVMGGLTSDGRVLTLVRQRALTGADTVAFLEHVGREIAAPALVVWDRSPIHRRAEVGDFIEAVGADGLAVEFLPAYAPDLNPVEWLWGHLKRVEMKNLTCLDLEELHEEFHLAVGRVRRKRRLVPAFFKGAGLAL
jgi:transposase